MKIYVSSTYQDLVDHRSAVDRTLRRMGHDVIGMEQYVAEGRKPLDAACRTFARRSVRGHCRLALRLPSAEQPPADAQVSITELEYQAAVAAGKPVLAFLLDPDSPWPLNRVDAMGTTSIPAGASRGFARSWGPII